MKFKIFTMYHIVRSEDLNLHKTLYAGKSVEWFLNAGYIAVTNILPPEDIVCLKIHGMVFSSYLEEGEIICYSAKTVFATKTTITVYIETSLHRGSKRRLFDGFVTYVHVNKNHVPTNHGIEIKPDNADDKKLHEMAKQLVMP